MSLMSLLRCLPPDHEQGPIRWHLCWLCHRFVRHLHEECRSRSGQLGLLQFRQKGEDVPGVRLATQYVTHPSVVLLWRVAGAALLV